MDVDVDADVHEVNEAMEGIIVTGMMTAIYFTLAIYINNLNVCPVDALSSKYDSILHKRELATLQSSLSDVRAECVSRTAQLEQTNLEASQFFFSADHLKAKERQAVASNIALDKVCIK